MERENERERKAGKEDERGRLAGEKVREKGRET